MGDDDDTCTVTRGTCDEANPKERDANAHTLTHRRRSKQNLLDHINLFPSKEERRIPGERNVLSERRIM